MNIAKIGIRTAGVVGAGAVLYDAHKRGVYQAKVYADKKDAEAAERWLDKSRVMTKPSSIMAKLKNKLFEFEIKHNFRHFFNSGIGYLKGFGQMIFEDVIPLGLSVGALVAKAPSATSKGIVSIASAAGLGAYGLYQFVKEVCGVGRDK